MSPGLGDLHLICVSTRVTEYSELDGTHKDQTQLSWSSHERQALTSSSPIILSGFARLQEPRGSLSISVAIPGGANPSADLTEHMKGQGLNPIKLIKTPIPSSDCSSPYVGENQNFKAQVQ